MAFPETGILDNFNIASGPPPNGWAFTARDNRTAANAQSGELYYPFDAGSQINSLYWTAQQFAANQECYISVGLSPVTSLSYAGLFLRLQNPTNPGSIDGYLARFSNNGGASFDVDIVLVNSGAEVLGPQVLASLSTNDGIGFSIAGTTLKVYHRSGLGGAWVEIASASDANISSAGYIGVEGKLFGE